MRFLILISIISLLFQACQQSPDVILDQEYLTFLNPKSLEASEKTLKEQLAYWTEKLELQPENQVYMQKVAALKSQEFKITHELSALDTSDNILKELRLRFPKNVSVLHQSVGNSMTRHAFNDALMYAEKALELGEKKDISQLLMVDIYLEKGMRDDARFLLEQLGQKEHFDRQIRWAKLHDAEGNLDQAVLTMESALAKADASKNKTLTCWALSNLGDMYGHQGRIKASYETYLKALALDPSDTHSLKGIGWIAFSYENDAKTASNIWSFIRKSNADPELDLLLSEAFKVLGMEDKARDHEEAFISKVKSNNYGNMYGSYLVDLLVEHESESALNIAKEDLAQRAHPVAYSKVALALFKLGEKDASIRMLQTFVLGQTEEPDALYAAAQVYSEAGEKRGARILLTDALSASYELGPIAKKDIEQRLERL